MQQTTPLHTSVRTPLSAHGGDLLRMAEYAQRDAQSIIDFSVNVRPDGAPEFIEAALTRAVNNLAAYPSPHAEEATRLAATRYGLDASQFVFGNGSNELIHALARVLARRAKMQANSNTVVYCIEPAFSEYALACQRANLTTAPLALPMAELIALSTEQQQERFLLALSACVKQVPHGAPLFFANPGNPSGTFIPREQLQELIASRPDILWVIDEAFIEYAGEEAATSLINHASDTCIILRSLTKFHAIPGVRTGFLVAGSNMAQDIQNELPAWNVNAFALAAACAALRDTSSFAEETRTTNAERRQQLIESLQQVPHLQVMPSAANYVLFRWKQAPHTLPSQLLQEYGIAVRDCANYHTLEDGTWFRVAVRFPHEHALLAHALQQCALQYNIIAQEGVQQDKSTSTTPYALDAISHRKAPALMLQGTSSNAGKSILAAAFCRILRQDGYDVAPYKAQNMSLNSGVTAIGHEMGRAQIVQAQAARVDPDARMNPILLKPHSDTGSQVVVLGKPIGHMGVRTYFERKKDLWHTVTKAYDELSAEHEVMVLEGAGSPGEINLKSGDLVNMRMAEYAAASVLLVGDIDRGGVYASFLGTWMTFTPAERRLLHGFLVNRFRGDASLLAPAHDYILDRTGTPVSGVVPYLRDLNIPEEDMAGFSWGGAANISAISDQKNRKLDVAVIMLRHVSNYTDFEPLALEPDVHLRPIRRLEEWGTPDIVLLPGSKSVAADLAELRASGLADAVYAHAQQGGWTFGICGGLQILGRHILDPLGIESNQATLDGLGVMNLTTTFEAEKLLTLVRGVKSPLGLPCKGYEIHHGITTHGDTVKPLFRDGDRICGYTQGKNWATYLHGVFDDDAFRRAFLDHVRQDVGLTPQGHILAQYDIDDALDRLAETVRNAVDMKTLYKSMGL